MMFLISILSLLLLSEIVRAGNNRLSKVSKDAPESSELTQQLEKEEDLLRLEKLLADMEAQRFQMISSKLISQGYEIHGFYHTSKWQSHWSSVIYEQLKLLDGKRKFPHLRKQPEFEQTQLQYPNFDPAHNLYYRNHTLPYAAYDWDENQTRYSSVLDISKKLYINIVGEDPEDYNVVKHFIQSLDLLHHAKLEFNFNLTIGRWVYDDSSPAKRKEYDRIANLSTGEYTTITKLQQYCQQKVANGEKAIVYYFHNKGTCCIKSRDHYNQPNPVANWREYLNTMNLEFPSICLRAIGMKRYLACGVENQDAHFSGNFWWADCAHVAKLPPLRKRYDFMESEYFILRGHEGESIKRPFGYKCGYSIYNCELNLYDDECTRHKYRKAILLKSIPGKLTPNNVYKKDDWTGKCRDLLKRPEKYWDMKQEVAKVIRGNK